MNESELRRVGVAGGPRCLPGWRSAAERALGIDVNRVERLARRHEQPVAAAPAKAQIGAALGQSDAADHLAVGGENRDAVEFARAPAAPQITVDIAAEAVRGALAGGFLNVLITDEDLARLLLER